MYKILQKAITFMAVSLLCFFSLQAQENSPQGAALVKTEPETQTETAQDLDFNIYLLVGSNNSSSGKIPTSLDGVTKQLKAALPFNHFEMRGVGMNRVAGRRGRFETKWGGETPGASTKPATFYEVSATGIELLNDSMIRVEQFRFGMRLPVRIGNQPEGRESYGYEPVGLTTGFSAREGEPAIIGTLSTGQGGEIGVLVVMLKRSLAK